MAATRIRRGAGHQFTCRHDMRANGPPARCGEFHEKASGGLGASLALMMGAAAAQAAPGYVTTNVNLRSGPGVQYPPVVVLGAGMPLEIFGCLSDTSWCDVDWNGNRGWVAGDFLEYSYQGRRVLVPEYAPYIGLPIVTFSFNDYWGRYYRGRSWYSRHDRWGPSRPPGWGGGPGWNGHGRPPPHWGGPGPGRPPGGGPGWGNGPGGPGWGGPGPGRPPGGGKPPQWAAVDRAGGWSWWPRWRQAAAVGRWRWWPGWSWRTAAAVERRRWRPRRSRWRAPAAVERRRWWPGRSRRRTAAAVERRRWRPGRSRRRTAAAVERQRRWRPGRSRRRTAAAVERQWRWRRRRWPAPAIFRRRQWGGGGYGGGGQGGGERRGQQCQAGANCPQPR